MASNSDATPKKDWQTTFLQRLAETGNIAKSCRAAKVDRSTAYRLRWADQEFKAAWDDALNIATSLLEDEAWRRAKDGVLKPVYQKGELVGKVREYSDTLLIFLLKAHAPEKYRETINTHHSGSVEVRRAEELSDDELAAIASRSSGGAAEA